jgi:hypothetical protein
MLRNLVAGATIAATLAAPVQAQEFRFTIPVQVSKLPGYVKTLSVTCEIGNGDSDRLVPAAKATSAPQAVDPTGSFNGEVTVTVAALGSPLQNAARPMYRCRIFFTAIDPTTRTTFDYFRSEDTSLMQPAPTWSTVKTFSTAATPAPALEARGQLPRP